jgi:hypothetical protein
LGFESSTSAPALRHSSGDFGGNLLTFEPFDIESFFKVTARAHTRARTPKISPLNALSL